MWRPKRQQTYSCLAVVLLVYGFLYTARNLLATRPDALLEDALTAAPEPLAVDTGYRPPGHQPEPADPEPTDPAIEAEKMCPEYSFYASVPHGPYSTGKYKLPYQRPATDCRKVVLPEVEKVISDMKTFIKDPDLARLFENCFPNTLDTSVTWTGISSTDRSEELTFVTTGDIPAMWLRDSANQLQSYVSLLTASPKRSSLASLFRGAINLQSRYITASPHCNAFQPPLESALAPGNNGNRGDFVIPPYDPAVVFECKYELDSLGAFLQLSWDYFNRTGDGGFFSRSGGESGWKEAVVRILDITEELRAGTYADDGMVPPSPYRFTRFTPASTETLPNGGNGSPVKGGTGLVRSAFRPSDDACTFQFLIPANMMLSRYLGLCAEIMGAVESSSPGSADPEEEDDDDDEDADAEKKDVAGRMRRVAGEIRRGIEVHGRVAHPELGDMYAYEVDGYRSANMMDDANLPSLLGAPLTGYVDRDDPVYRATRRFVMSTDNPYYDHGPVINGTGGPHIGPGMAWPMSLIVAIMTSDDDDEIVGMLGQIVSSTDGLGLIHESVNVYNQGMWTRAWFSWANGLFGQMMLDLKERKPHLLKTSFQ